MGLLLVPMTARHNARFTTENDCCTQWQRKEQGGWWWWVGRVTLSSGKAFMCMPCGCFPSPFLSIDLNIECYLASLSKPERVVLDSTGRGLLQLNLLHDVSVLAE